MEVTSTLARLAITLLVVPVMELKLLTLKLAQVLLHSFPFTPSPSHSFFSFLYTSIPFFLTL